MKLYLPKINLNSHRSSSVKFTKIPDYVAKLRLKEEEKKANTSLSVKNYLPSIQNPFEKKKNTIFQNIYSNINKLNDSLKKIKQKTKVNKSFDLDNYQKKLRNIYQENVDDCCKNNKCFENMNENFNKINLINNPPKTKRFKNRWDIFADKMKNRLPDFLIKKVKKLGNYKLKKIEIV
jgi:hydroxymethylpyrimidine pyrophosphatase-like HAD family hydrolase